MAAAAAGALAARAALSLIRSRTAGRAGWTRTNFRGATVNLAAGPALAVAATAAAAGARAPAAAATLTAGLGAGGVGLYDDLVGDRPEHRAKGFHGHLAALRRGQVTSGLVKVAGIGAASLAASTLLPGRSWRAMARGSREVGGSRTYSMINTLLGAGVIAGSANLLNLLDLRPGRALKAGLLIGLPLAASDGGGALAAGPVGAAAALLPEDLGEEVMLGDCGANALGALLGTALAARTGPAGRAVALAMITGLTAASERISFTQVIAKNPVLRRIDELGRHRRAASSGAGGMPAGSDAGQEAPDSVDG